jgi:hypothetical protein
MQCEQKLDGHHGKGNAHKKTKYKCTKSQSITRIIVTWWPSSVHTKQKTGLTHQLLATDPTTDIYNIAILVLGTTRIVNYPGVGHNALILKPWRGPTSRADPNDRYKMDMPIHIYTHAYIHTYIHTYIHIYILYFPPPPMPH